MIHNNLLSQNRYYQVEQYSYWTLAIGMEIASTDPSIHKLLDNGRAEPPYGSRLLPNVVDELANTDPTRVYATIPLSSDISQGFRDVTMLEVAQSVDHFAFWLETSFGRSSSFETLAYMGIPDLRYAIVFLAAVKCGYKVKRSASMQDH